MMIGFYFEVQPLSDLMSTSDRFLGRGRHSFGAGVCVSRSSEPKRLRRPQRRRQALLSPRDCPKVFSIAQ